MTPARAVELPVFVHVEHEQDLHDLLDEGLLDTHTVQGLLDLLRTRVDLSTAGRDALHALPNLSYAEVDAIVRYREDHGGRVGVRALAAAGVVSERKLMAIRAFLVEEAPPSAGAKGRRRVAGELRLVTHWMAQDPRAPPGMLQARARVGEHVRMGVAGVLARMRAGSLAFDRGREGLVAEAPRVRPDVPKLYLQWGTGSWRFIAGTYRVGFAQGLTFDTTGIRRADGFLPDDTLRRAPLPVRACRLGAGELAASPCAGPAGHVLATPDFGWTEGLRGLAVSVRDVAAGPGTLEVHGFLSWQAHSVYQYQLVDRGACPAPGGEGCSAPPVHVRLDDPQAAAPAHAWQTFPRVHDLGVLGARVAYRLSPRTHVGATAYGAGVRWRAPGMALDFQDWARLPYGGPFGAIGVDAAFGRRRVDAQLEVAHSLDSMPGGGGGVGAIGRMVAAVGAGELDASVRYYDRRFANPFARPLSAADRFGGLRARDELGARVAYAGHVPALHLDLRGMADLWHRPSLGVTRWRTRLRADHRSGSHWRPGLEVDFTDQDLGEPGRGPCVLEGAQRGASSDCGGMRYHLTGRLELAVGSLLRATVRYRHSFVTDRQLVGRFRQDASTWATVRLQAMPTLRLAARVRHLLIDLSDGDRHEHSLRGHLEARWTAPGGHITRVRYELIAWLDGRESTALRVPSPVHWLWVEVQIRFGKGGDDD